jgi:hypothetical protein
MTSCHHLNLFTSSMVPDVCDPLAHIRLSQAQVADCLVNVGNPAGKL